MDYFAPSHLLILLVIILIIFGPSKLGDVGGALGRAIRDFKGAMNEPDSPKPVVKSADTVTAESKAPGRTVYSEHSPVQCKSLLQGSVRRAIASPADIGRLQRAPRLS